MDVGEHTAGGDGDGAQQLGELLVVADGQLDVAGHDAGLLVVAGGVAGELQHLTIIDDKNGEPSKSNRKAHLLGPGAGLATNTVRMFMNIEEVVYVFQSKLSKDNFKRTAHY